MVLGVLCGLRKKYTTLEKWLKAWVRSTLIWFLTPTCSYTATGRAIFTDLVHLKCSLYLCFTVVYVTLHRISRNKVNAHTQHVVTRSHTNGMTSLPWGSDSNRLFLVNGWPSHANGWHNRLVNRKLFENGKSLVYVFLSKVTNIKSLNGCNNKTCLVYNPSSLYKKTVFALHVYSSTHIYAILSFNTAEIDSPFGWTVPSWIIPHLSKEVEEGFALHHTRSLSY